MSNPYNGGPGHERSKVIVHDLELRDDTVTMGRVMENERVVEKRYGIQHHAYYGSIGLPYTRQPGTPETQFVVHIFVPTTFASPNMAHACANSPGEQLGREEITGATPSDVVLISDHDLNILTQWNARAQRAPRTADQADEEWRVRNMIAARSVIVGPSMSINLGRLVGLPFADQIQEAYEDPNRLLKALEISRKHCLVQLDQYSLLSVTDLASDNGTSVSFAV